MANSCVNLRPRDFSKNPLLRVYLMNMTSQTRRNRLVLVVASSALLIGILVLARGALFPFVISSVLAYVLFPVVRTLESWTPWRHRWPTLSRVTAILLIYLASVGVVAGIALLIIPPAVRQATEFIDDVPELFHKARTTIEGWNEEYTDRIPESVRVQIESSLESGGSILIDVGQSVLSKTFGAVSNILTTVIGLAIVPFLLFYLLKDRETAIEGFYSLLPSDVQRHARNVVAIANQVLGAYIRAQLTLGVIVGVSVFLGLFLLGIKFSVLLGVIAGITELVPVIGPLLGAIPGVLVALATSPEDVVWVILLYVGIQLVENVLLLPRIQGKAVDIHPAIIMVILVVGSEVAGIWGVVVGVPLAAVARDVFKYFHQEWSPARATLEEDTSPPADPTEAT